MQFRKVETFDDWRSAARDLIAKQIPPQEVHWSSDRDQQSLFASSDSGDIGEPNSTPTPSVIHVPSALVDLARRVSCHRDANRWELLYRTLWRIVHEQRNLLEITTDDDVHQLAQMQKAVSRDVHKMKAFVRFRKVGTGDDENYVAWHRPDHHIVPLAAPFFARRFKAMNWSILTPDASVSWDQQQLRYGPGVPVSEAPDEDALEDLWKTYYSSIFNPARIKLAMMKREMPVRHWPTMPETELVPELLQQAPARVETMIDSSEGFGETAAHYMPDEITLANLAAAARCCRACDLHNRATQTVFGEGPGDARIVLVGEQPGDREDIEGKPFVGPAGQLLGDALAEAGIERSEVYVTNVVKHYKFTERGKRRLHQKPGSREIFACRPWLEAELSVIGPEVIVALGATSAQALIGRDFRITRHRGEIVSTEWCDQTLATWHPAAVLRMTDPHRREDMRSQLVRDLSLAVECLKQ